MKIDIITIFPDMVRAGLGFSIVKRAQDAGHVQATAHDLRDHAPGKHRATDDSPYGGGAGMVMLPGPLFAAVESLPPDVGARIVLLTPQGRDVHPGEGAGTFPVFAFGAAVRALRRLRRAGAPST